jgi:hypothetical protein
MDLDTDQRRQINRNNRNTRDKLPDNLLAVLRTASAADADSLLRAIRDNASSHHLGSLVQHLSRDIDPQDEPTPSSFETADWLQTPIDSESFDDRRPSLVDGHGPRPQDEQMDALQFGSATGVHMSLGSSRTDRLSQVMLSFREAASTQIAMGANVRQVLSMDGIELDVFFRDRTAIDPHTISTWACEFARSWTSLLPVSQLAVLYLAGAFMRWFILPCRETYALMSLVLQPMEGNVMVHNFSEVEFCWAHGVDWINALTHNVKQLTWPYDYVACLEELAAGMSPQARRFSRLFMDYCDNAANWTDIAP